MITIINFVTYSLGDNTAFSPYADLYQQKVGGKVYVKTKWHKYFKSSNLNVEFVNTDFTCDGAEIKNINFLFQRGPLQKIICDTLGLEYKEIRPTLTYEDKNIFNKKKKYVCIAVQSTSQMKYWNKNNGWDKVVRFLKTNGYDVYCIDKDEVFGTKEHWNYMPKSAYNETGNYDIGYRMEQLKKCEFFIGTSSGLAWVAWALGKKVVLISGCTDEDNEFSDAYRVINKNVCHGCLNDPTIDNVNGILGGWLYCPRNKNFECSKEISYERVQSAILKCMGDINQTKLK